MVFTHKPTIYERILMELLDLDGVIEKGVFEIPSYQRGYAWQMRQLKDFLERFRACVQTGR